MVALCLYGSWRIAILHTAKDGRAQYGAGDGHAGTIEAKAGYHYQPMTTDWQTLTAPFAKRLHGHNQVTDAYLLGLAVQEGLVLTTFDKALLHLVGEQENDVLVLEAN